MNRRTKNGQQVVIRLKIHDEPRTIVFRSDDAGALIRVLRDTFGPYLAESAGLLFTEDGVNRRYIDRDAVLNLDPPNDCWAHCRYHQIR